MDSDIQDRFESQPLLADDERDPEDIASPRDGGPRRNWAFAVRLQPRSPKTIVLLLAVLIFVVATSGMMIMVPIFRLVEDAACHDYYKKDPSEKIDERLCKVDEVQSRIAYLGGWAAMLNSVVGLIAVLPYGVLADKIGRKPTFILSYIGIILAFGWGPFMLGVVRTTNLYLVMLGSLFFFIGGGVPVAMNCLMAMTADISVEAEKSTNFLYLSFGAVAGSLVGPAIAGILMETVSPWLPILCVFAVTPLVFCILLFIPETLAIRIPDAPDEEPDPRSKMSKKPFGEALRELRVSVTLLKNINILLSMVTSFIQPALFVGYSTTLSQYVSKYFGWTLAQTSYLLGPPLGILHLVIILLIPWISGLLTSTSGRFQLSIFSKDLLLTKASLFFMIVGGLMEGVSQEVALFLVGLTVGNFGSAHGPLLRAVATSYVEPDQTSRLYSLMTMVETSGAVVGGPVLAKCFSVGLEKRGLWRGLPWFYITGLVCLAFTALLFVRAPKQKPPTSDGEETGDLGYQSAEEQP
ncbi:hypothetical protein OQA88_8540 [Cercophora sp. LCS_1]